MKKVILALLAAVALPFAAQAQVVDAVQADGFGLKLVYPAVHAENAKAQEMINKDIAAYVDGMKAKYDARKNVSMSYAAKFEDEKYVSLVMSTSVMEQGAANPENFEHGVVYSKVTGERVPLGRAREESEEGRLEALQSGGQGARVQRRVRSRKAERRVLSCRRQDGGRDLSAGRPGSLFRGRCARDLETSLIAA